MTWSLLEGCLVSPSMLPCSVIRYGGSCGVYSWVITGWPWWPDWSKNYEDIKDNDMEGESEWLSYINKPHPLPHPPVLPAVWPSPVVSVGRARAEPDGDRPRESDGSWNQDRRAGGPGEFGKSLGVRNWKQECAQEVIPTGFVLLEMTDMIIQFGRDR